VVLSDQPRIFGTYLDHMFLALAGRKLVHLWPLLPIIPTD
jgi:hypothetical protein